MRKPTIRFFALLTLSAVGVACTGPAPVATLVPTATAEPPAVPTASPVPTPTPTPAPPPTAAFTVDNAGGSAPLAVRFQDTSQGLVRGWQWDFGDGSSSSDRNPAHDYTKAGSQTVRLTVSGPGGQDTVTVRDAVTVGAGALAKVTVRPSPVVLPVMGSVRLGANAEDSYGNEVPGTVFSWSAMGAAVSVDEAGRVVAATTAGSYQGLLRVTASRGEDRVEASVDVTVGPGPLHKAVIEPARVALDIGAAQTFALRVSDEFDNEVSDALLSWAAIPEAGAVDDKGAFRAGTRAGVFPNALQANVVSGSIRVSVAAEVTIHPDPLARVVVRSGDRAGIAKGSKTQFTAVGLDRHGNEIPGLAFLWQATGGSIGQDGLFVPTGGFGRRRITASATYKGAAATGTGFVDVLPTWTPAGGLSSFRFQHTATLLENGQVLIVGGIVGGLPGKEAELYDPSIGAFRGAGNGACTHGPGATATRLSDGRVLIVGGDDGGRCAQIYDPVTSTFSRTGDMQVSHSRHTATLLPDGKVLIAGGQVVADSRAEAEVFDPVTNAFALTGRLITDRAYHVALLLPTGQVLIAGGSQIRSRRGQCVESIELYNPAAEAFSPSGTMQSGCMVGGTLLGNGKVLLTIGDQALAQLYDPVTNTVQSAGEMNQRRANYTATLLQDGRVLIVGGRDPRVDPPVGVPSVEVYDPESDKFTTMPDLTGGRWDHTTVLLPSGGVLVVGGSSTLARALLSAEIAD